MWQHSLKSSWNFSNELKLFEFINFYSSLIDKTEMCLLFLKQHCNGDETFCCFGQQQKMLFSPNIKYGISNVSHININWNSLAFIWDIVWYSTVCTSWDISISYVRFVVVHPVYMMFIRWGHPAPMSKFWLWQPLMVWPYIYLTHPNHCQTFFLNSWYPPFWFFNDCLYRFLCRNSVFSDFDPFSL